MKEKVFFMILFFLSVFSALDASTAEYTFTSEGVTVDYSKESGSVMNNNSFPVRIQKVFVGAHGEKTIWIKVVRPREKIPIPAYHAHSFYIRTMDGGMIGFIHHPSRLER